MTILAAAALREGLAVIRQAPADEGTVELIVRRPAVDAREVVASATTSGEAASGDAGPTAGTSCTPRSALMNARTIDLLGGDRGRWPLAGDQLYVDLDLGEASLPPGARAFRIGTALLELSARRTPGAGSSPRGSDEALAFVNSDEGRSPRLRGANCFVVEGGVVRTGDRVAKA
ncbi:MAG: MOSC domain-containing protein [Actinomycetota bacterium]